MFEGLVGGFGKAYGAHQKETAARTAKQGELEQSILGRLLGSDNPDIQMRAMQAMMQSAGGSKGKKKGGILGSLGDTEPSPAFTSLFEHLRGMDTKGTPGRAATPATPDTVTNREEGGVPTQTVTAGDPGTPAVEPTTPDPLFRTSQERGVAAGSQDRQNRMDAIAKLGGSPEQVMTAQGVPQMRPQQRRGTLVSETGKQTMVDSSTGEPMATYGARPSTGGGNRMVTMEGKQLLVDAQGNTIQTYGARPSTETAPRDREGYLNAGAAKEQIDAALLAQFGELKLDNPMPPFDVEIQQMREELARKFNFQSYDDLQRNAATRRGEMGMSAPPSDGAQGISGQGEAVDTQRVNDIVQAQQAGRPPTPEEQEFVRRYLEMYRDQLEP